ncbi:MAG TPA: MMPL family transporter [Xanthobacteraceae bacterium]|jgi:hopanoid biosynthesis associated RND transporter like protein HpnN|nr:MMPL family transporter [Xanthobacteraceae bacterium]
MLKSLIASVVARCTHRPWLIILGWVVLAVAAGVYTADNFAISTDIGKLLDPNLSFQKQDQKVRDAFPQQSETIVAVVDAPTPEQASVAAHLLAERLRQNPTLFKDVQEPGSGPFFDKNGLLFLPEQQLEQTAGQLTDASPLLATLAGDPSLRGITQGLSLALKGVETGRLTLANLAPVLDKGSETIETVLAGKPASFSFQELLPAAPDQPSARLRFVTIHPMLDYSSIEPGKEASDAVRKAAVDLGLPQKYQARVRLTGAVPIADEEFATIQEGALGHGIATIVIVLVILWLALRSGRIIFAVFANMVVGLAVTAALGLIMVGALNLISVAFAVLFIGLGVDFGIQYAVRYRTERHASGGLQDALVRAGANAGPQLTLAAAAVAAGFLSFLPTAYRGVSELGQIAGVGMIIAFITSITLLPALLKVLNPPGEPDDIGYRFLAPVDDFLERRRILVLAGTAIVVLAGLPLLFYLRFDFNPINLRSRTVESISTYLDLRRNPNAGGNGIDVLTPSLKDADAVAARLAKLPEVSRTITLSSFIPDAQDKKLAVVAKMKEELGDILTGPPDPAPTDAETITALRTTADQLKSLATPADKPGATSATRLATALTKLSAAKEDVRQRAEAAFVAPLKVSLADLNTRLQAQPVARDTLPAQLVRDWITPDGRARVEVDPKGDPEDNEVTRRFADAVLAVQPNASGGPVSILESGKTIVRAFIEAGIWAILSIAVILFIVLRRVSDVLLTLIPLMVAGILTLEISVLIGMPLNFANIIALPLLLGLGVAFKIYYIMAWRAGQTGLLQTSLTRAVIFSAMTTATAFGSLWLSSHPGTSSMGKLLALSLACTLAAAVLFQPALMGRPRGSGDGSADGA